MNYLRKNLMPDEQMVAETELHWIIFFAPAFYSCMLVIYIFFRPHNFPVLIDLVALAFIVILWLNVMIRYMNTEFAVTRNRVLMKQGLIQTKVFGLLMSRVESAQLHKGFGATILGFGTVTINGIGGDHIVFSNISNPNAFYQKILEQNQAAKI